jgi:2-oxo-3-hexenedioate decarboxylase/2-keto-4-pentenoate hydratase
MSTCALTRNEIDEAACWLVAARLDGRQASACPLAQHLAAEEAGYTLQTAGHRVLAEEGFGRLVGYKIGCTNQAVQDLLAVPGPAYGGILAASLHWGEAEIARAPLQHPGIECEIAFWINRPPEPSEAPYDRESIRPCVAACSAAMEIVDNRYGDFRSAPFGLMIADDFFHSAAIVGSPVAAWQDLDLAALGGTTLLNGQVAGTGSGANVLGHPLEALAWLANRLIAQDKTLQGGQVVLTGTMVDPIWLEADVLQAAIEVEGLGRATAYFG